MIQSIVDFDAEACVKAMDNLGCLKEGTDFKKVEVSHGGGRHDMDLAKSRGPVSSILPRPALGSQSGAQGSPLHCDWATLREGQAKMFDVHGPRAP